MKFTNITTIPMDAKSSQRGEDHTLHIGRRTTIKLEKINENDPYLVLVLRQICCYFVASIYDLTDIVVADVIFTESDTIVGLWLAMKRWARGGVESGGGGGGVGYSNLHPHSQTKKPKRLESLIYREGRAPSRLCLF